MLLTKKPENFATMLNKYDQLVNRGVIKNDYWIQISETTFNKSLSTTLQHLLLDSQIKKNQGIWPFPKRNTSSHLLYIGVIKNSLRNSLFQKKLSTRFIKLCFPQDFIKLCSHNFVRSFYPMYKVHLTMDLSLCAMGALTIDWYPTAFSNSL